MLDGQDPIDEIEADRLEMDVPGDQPEDLSLDEPEPTLGVLGGGGWPRGKLIVAVILAVPSDQVRHSNQSRPVRRLPRSLLGRGPAGRLESSGRVRLLDPHPPPSMIIIIPSIATLSTVAPIPSGQRTSGC